MNENASAMAFVENMHNAELRGDVSDALEGEMLLDRMLKKVLGPIIKAIDKRVMGEKIIGGNLTRVIDETVAILCEQVGADKAPELKALLMERVLQEEVRLRKEPGTAETVKAARETRLNQFMLTMEAGPKYTHRGPEEDASESPYTA
jgi:hypothetical protein